MKLVTKKSSEIKPYKNNPRKNDMAVDDVAESIRQCEYNEPIVVDENNVILCGHTRLKALKQLGYDEAEVIVKEGLTEKQKKKYRLLDNQTATKSEWDYDKLMQELDGMDFEGFDFGFDLDMDEESEAEAVEDDYDEEPPAEPKSKMGDIYQLGRHRLMCGDSTKAEDVAKLIDGKKIDISFSSPPYNAGTTPTEVHMGMKTKYNGKDDNKTEKEYCRFLNDYLNVAIEWCEYVFMNVQSISNNKIALIDVLHDNKEIYADTLIWDKQNGQPAMAHNVLNSCFEFIHCFSKKANRAIGTIDFRGTIDNIVRIPPQRSNKYADIHNATFSVEFAGWFIGRFAKKSVYDPFGGTGTTLIASEQLNRTCYMMELSPQYIDVIIDRWEKFTGQKAVKIS